MSVKCDPEIQGGAPCIAGTRLPVRDVQDYVAQNGRERFKRAWGYITDAQLDAALAYDGDVRHDDERKRDERRALRVGMSSVLMREARRDVQSARAEAWGNYASDKQHFLRRAAIAVVLALLLEPRRTEHGQ